MNTIKISYLKITGRFFYCHQLRNLKNLSLIGCQLREPNGFISFLEDKPNLISFTLNQSSLRGMDNVVLDSSNSVFEAFVYDANEGYLNEQNKFKMHSIYIQPNFQLMYQFKKLKSLKMLTVPYRSLFD